MRNSALLSLLALSTATTAGCELFTGVDETFVPSDATADSSLDVGVDSTVSDADANVSPDSSADAVSDADAIPDSSADTSVADSAPDANPCNEAGACTPGSTQVVTGTCTNVGDVNQQTCSARCEWSAPACGPRKGWRTMAAPPTSFVARENFSAVWTGAKVIFAGGDAAGSYFDTAASYEVATDTWNTLQSMPTIRMGHCGAWTGKKMIVWGGDGQTGYHGDGMSLDEATGDWTAIASSPLSPRLFPNCGWSPAASKLVVWGGRDESTSGDPEDGALYDPALDSWTPMAAIPAAHSGATVTWTGRFLVVLGGVDPNTFAFLGDGYSYDPSTNKWTHIAAPSGSAPVRTATSVGVSGDMLFLFEGDVSGSTRTDTSLIFDSTPFSWSAIGIPDATALNPIDRVASSIWFGNGKWWVWSGRDMTTGRTVGDGASYDPVTGTWSAMTTDSSMPEGRLAASVVAIGPSVLVWGGSRFNGAETDFLSDGAIYTP